MIPAMNKRQSGFTTIELLITVVLAGVLIAMAAPSFSGLVANSRVADQTNELIGAMNLARSEAIRRNASLTLCRTATADSTDCLGGDANWQNWILRTSAGTVVRRGTFNNFGNTQQVSSTLASESITYSPDGLTRTGGALVNAADDDAHVFIVCSTRVAADNVRRLRLGSGSRITTSRESGACG